MYTYRCVTAQTLENDITAFELEPLNQICPFIPGQYIELTAPNLAPMPISLSYVPRQNGHLSFVLRHDDKHPNAKKLLPFLHSGQPLHISEAKGHCTRNNLPRFEHLLFLAGGTGIVPHLSFLQEALPHIHKPITLLWGVKDPQDLFAQAQLDAWQVEYPHLKVTCFEGMVHEHLSQYRALTNTVVMACGPYQMVQKCWQYCEQHGLPRKHYFSDMFRQ